MIENCKVLLEEKVSKNGVAYTVCTVCLPNGVKVSLIDHRLENAILRARLERVDK